MNTNNSTSYRGIGSFQSHAMHYGALMIGPLFAFAALGLVCISLVQVFKLSDESNAFRHVLVAGEYWRTVLRTLLYATLAVALKVVFVWPLALSLNQARHKAITLFYLIPWLIPPSISALAWLWFFYDMSGGANSILHILGFGNVPWLGKPNTAFLICLFFNVWREIPLWAIVISPILGGFGGSLQSLAFQDGLTRLERIWLLIVPRLRPSIVALCILSYIWSAGEFESIWLLTRGGPGESTQLLTVFAYRQAFLSQNLATGAAAFVIFIPISIVVLTFLLLLYSHWVDRARWKS